MSLYGCERGRSRNEVANSELSNSVRTEDINGEGINGPKQTSDAWPVLVNPEKGCQGIC